jgi:hypothetical protein
MVVSMLPLSSGGLLLRITPRHPDRAELPRRACDSFDLTLDDATRFKYLYSLCITLVSYTK